MSKLFVDEIVHQSSQGSGTITLGASGETIALPSGSTLDLSNTTVSGFTSGFTLGTKVTASGTSVEFTSIPSSARMIVINTDGLSHNAGGNDDMKVQIGDSGGYETTGYKATAVYLSTNTGEASPGGASYTDSFVFNYQPNGGNVIHSQMIFTCQDTTSNTWNFSNRGSAYSAGYIQVGAGVKSLSGTLDRIKLFTNGGASWDAGTVNIMYI